MKPSGGHPARELQQGKKKKKTEEESPEFDEEGGTASSPAQAESLSEEGAELSRQAP